MSQPVTVTIPHQLGAAEARRRIDNGFADFARHMGNAPGASFGGSPGARPDLPRSSSQSAHGQASRRNGKE